MRTRKVDRTSWHYKVATGMGFNSDQHDWCAYCRRVLFGCLLLVCGSVAVLIIGAGAIFMTSDALAWLVYCILNITLVSLTFEGGVAIVVYSILLVILGLRALVMYVDENGLPDVGFTRTTVRVVGKMYRTQIIPQDTKDFFWDFYNSFKEKYCFKIEVE